VFSEFQVSLFMSGVVVELISIFLIEARAKAQRYEMKHPVNKTGVRLAIFAILRRQGQPLLMKNRTNREPDLICSCLGWANQ
jgi:hypothetical protein